MEIRLRVAPWCPPCRLETSDLVAAAKASLASDTAFLGIDTTETSAVVRAFAATKGVPYAQVATTNRSAFVRDYHIVAYPTTIVIDPSGIVRAIHADNVLPRAQLDAYVAAARRGESAPLASDEQWKLDAMLAPASSAFDGDPSAALAAVRAADTAIANADAEMDDAMIDPARDRDLLRTKSEQDALRARAIAALQQTTRAQADEALLARMRGDQAVADARHADAVTAYDAALAIDPIDRAALGGLTYALAETGDDRGAIDSRKCIATLAPSYANEIALAANVSPTARGRATSSCARKRRRNACRARIRATRGISNMRRRRCSRSVSRVRRRRSA